MYEKKIIDNVESKLLYRPEFSNVNLWLPPIELDEQNNVIRCWGEHHFTGELLEDIDIIKRSNTISEQYWELQPKMERYNEIERVERFIYNFNANSSLNTKNEYKKLYDYIDKFKKFKDYSNTYKLREFKRRVYGIILYINGIPTYLTGDNYFALQHFKSMGQHLQYQSITNYVYSHINWVFQNPNVFGGIYLVRRRFGKSTITGAVTLNRVTLNKHFNVLAQSTDEVLMESLFNEHMVKPLQELDYYNIPIFDRNLGTNPKDKFSFKTTTDKNREATFYDNSLKSNIRTFATETSDEQKILLDGERGDIIIIEEHAKVKINVEKKLTSLKKTITGQDGNTIKGKILLPTTTEKISSTNRFVSLVNKSIPFNANDKTLSGLVLCYLPSQYTGKVDIYGNQINSVKDELELILNNRTSPEDDYSLYIDSVLQSTTSLSEALTVGISGNYFNSENISKSLNIYRGEKFYVYGNFLWEKKYEKVVFKETDTKNYTVKMPRLFYQWFEIFKKSYNISNSKATFIEMKQLDIYSLYTLEIDILDDFKNISFPPFFSIGLDPIDMSKGTSDISMHVNCNYIPTTNKILKDLFFDNIVCQLIKNPSRDRLDFQFEQALKFILYFGSKILIESNRDGGLIDKFRKLALGNLLYMGNKKNKYYGISKQTDTETDIINLMNDYFNVQSKNGISFFNELNKTALNYTDENKEKSHALYSSYYSRIGKNLHRSINNLDSEFNDFYINNLSNIMNIDNKMIDYIK